MQRKITASARVRKTLHKEKLKRNESSTHEVNVPKRKSPKETKRSVKLIRKIPLDEKVSLAEHLLPEADNSEVFSPIRFWQKLGRDGGKIIRVTILILIVLIALATIAAATNFLFGLKIDPFLSIWIHHDLLSFCIYSMRILAHEIF